MLRWKGCLVVGGWGGWFVGGEGVGEWGVVGCRLEHKRSNWTKLEDHFEEVCLLSPSTWLR